MRLNKVRLLEIFILNVVFFIINVSLKSAFAAFRNLYYVCVFVTVKILRDFPYDLVQSCGLISTRSKFSSFSSARNFCLHTVVDRKDTPMRIVLTLWSTFQSLYGAP